jgi:protein-tyrosine-phosphatase
VTFDVAFICTGNRYRSVIAEAAFRSSAGELPVRVGSFGTLDVGPAGPLPEAFRAAREFDLDITAHVARCVTGADLSGASLVLGFERPHVAVAVVEAGARPDRTFSLLELVELLDRVGTVPGKDPVQRAVETIARAHELRGAVHNHYAGAEIEDPVGKPRSRQLAIGRQVYLATTELAERLLGSGRPGSSG